MPKKRKKPPTSNPFNASAPTKKKKPNSGPGTYGKAWGTRGVPGAMKAQGLTAGKGKFGGIPGSDLNEDGSPKRRRKKPARRNPSQVLKPVRKSKRTYNI